MTNLLKAMVLATTALTAFPLAAQAEPLAWIVSDEDSRIVLFPTVHALPEGLEWQTPALNDVIAASGEVWTEIGDPKDPAIAAEVQKLVGELGMSPDMPLSQRLSPGQFAALSETAAQLGVPVAALEPLRPWLAALALTQAGLAASGFSAERGVETVLSAQFAGRPVRQLETVAQQTRLLADMVPDDQIDFLMETVDTADEAGARLKAIAEDWAVGDISAMENELLAEMRTEYPGVYAIMFTQRNKTWADILSAELAGSGTDFIAVGAGHLVSADGVPELLKARGYKVERVKLSDLKN